MFKESKNSNAQHTVTLNDQMMPKIILHLITCRIIWLLRRMKKKRNSDQPISIHQDHLVDLIEVLKDNAAQHKPK